MTTGASHLSCAAQYWAAFLGCDESHLESPDVVLVPQFIENDYEGCYLFRRGEGVIVSVIARAPASLFQRVEREVVGRPAEAIFARGFWEERFAGEYKRLMGPAFVGYTCAEAFREEQRRTVRRLLPARREDAAALRRLFAACTLQEWEYGGIQFEHDPIMGAFEGERLVAAASYELWTDRIAHMGAVTDPDFRGGGYGTSAVSALTRHCLEAGLIPQYRTLESNSGAMAIAHRLGFSPYAQTMSITFRDLE